MTKPSKTTKVAKSYSEMTTRELAEATREFDEPFVMDRGRPLNAAERSLHRLAAKRGRGRPKIGKGSERINITIERNLLARADAVARQQKIGRSEMIASALKLLISRKAS